VTAPNIPKYLKSIYVLVADDKLGSNTYFNRFASLLKAYAAHHPDLAGWSVEVRRETGAENVLRHIQVRPVDLVILDCNFDMAAGTRKDSEDERKDREVNREDLIDITKYMFKSKLYFVGLDLHEYLHIAKTYTLEINKNKKQQQVEYDIILFTSYRFTGDMHADTKGENNKFYKTIKERNLTVNKLVDVGGLSNCEASIINYLWKKDPTAIDQLCMQLVSSKRRIMQWWERRNSPPRGHEYLLLNRYMSYKFAHHDWQPEYIRCVKPSEACKTTAAEEEHFSIPGWTVYSRGRKFDAPDSAAKGVFFAFPQNSSVENLSKPGCYEGKTVVNAMKAFVEYLEAFKDKNRAYVFCGHHDTAHVVNKTNAYKLASVPLEKFEQHKSGSWEFADIVFPSPLWLAATPLTGSTMAGEESDVIEHFIGKINFLLKLGFGAGVLKTVYPVDESKAHWPKEDMYYANQSRCFASNNTFYNTGSTANEAFFPALFNKVLHEMLSSKWENQGFVKTKIIPSFGAHSNDCSTWSKLFTEVFLGIPDEEYPIVEINARHAIREIAKRSGLNGDEYFHPHSSDTSDTIAKLTAFYGEFNEWVQVVASVAGTRKLIFKFPYRVDLFVFLSICEDLKKTYGNICGVTLVNTFKSPYWADAKKEKTPNNPDFGFNGWRDVIKHPQVSGAALIPLRNYILDILSDKSFVPNKFTLDISASGGIMDESDVFECLSLGAASVQIGTSMLMVNTALMENRDETYPSYVKSLMTGVEKANLNRSETKQKNKPSHIYMRNRQIIEKIYGGEFERFVKRRVCFDISKCNRCGSCYSTYYCDAFLNRHVSNKSQPIKFGDDYFDTRFPILDLDACVGCGLCVQVCKHHALSLELPTLGNGPSGGAFVDESGFGKYVDKNRCERPLLAKKLVLASSSPRRQAIMRELGLYFDIAPPNIFDEKRDGQDAIELIKSNAKGKAEEIVKRYSGKDVLVIGCDTVIINADGKILGKPNGIRDYARNSLLSLSGRKHRVLSAVAIYDSNTMKSIICHESTVVLFRDLSYEEIDAYISTGEPLDKAGAYAIQGRGELFVENIEGSISNVVGLPKELLMKMLDEMGYKA
jgi:septum formation protein